MGIAGDVRRSEAAAQQVLESLIPKKQFGVALRILQSAILLAHRLAPTRWGVRVDPNNVMLKIGRVEVLQITPDGLHLVIVGKRAPVWARDRLYGSRDRPTQVYESIPGS